MTALFSAVHSVKYRALLMTCYASGLRISEACQLRVEDVDSRRMVLRVRQGKGSKERYTVLSPRLLEGQLGDLVPSQHGFSPFLTFS